MPPCSNNIAVLMTCHNRSETTLHCLEALYNADDLDGYTFDVFLVDDGSTDGTAEGIKAHYSQVNIIQGNGSLYWCGGMRLAWEVAASRFNYNFYLLLNDDVVVNKKFLYCIFEDYNKITQKHYTCLITGCCCDPETGTFTYGGRNDRHLLPPVGSPQQCKFIHGNIVLIPRIIFDKIGGLSNLYTHAFGDTDYGLRSIKAGFSCWTSSKYIGKCRQHTIKGPWASSKIPLKQRISLFYNPLGLNFKEYVIFRKQHWPFRWWLDVVKVCIQLLCPYPFEVYSQIRSKWINANK